MINIAVLGRLSVTGSNGRTADLHTARGSELFAFLVLEADRVFHRSRLAEQIWGHLPESRGRKALNTELWRVTTALKAIGVDTKAALRRTQNEVGYCRQLDHVIDVDALTAAIEITRSIDPAEANTTALKTVTAGIAAYRGDLLESVYSDWCLLWRESLRNQHLSCLSFMLRASMARREWEAALNHGRDLLVIDPLMEDVHRAVMRCHFHNGNRPLALRQYALCEQLLREELDVEPMDETRRIQQTILAVPSSPPGAKQRAVPRVPRSAGRRSPAQKVDMALSNINSARNWLENVSQDLRKPTDQG